MKQHTTGVNAGRRLIRILQIKNVKEIKKLVPCFLMALDFFAPFYVWNEVSHVVSVNWKNFSNANNPPAVIWESNVWNGFWMPILFFLYGYWKLELQSFTLGV